MADIRLENLRKEFDDGAVVDLAAVLAAGLVSQEKHTELFKVLGNGTLERKLTLKVDAISGAAKEKVEAAGGSVEIKERPAHRPKFVRKGQTEPTPKRVKKDAES